jgi:hypothetical protein
MAEHPAERAADQALAARLKDVRLKDLRGISRRALAGELRKLGVQIEEQGVTLGRYEEGERDPPAVLVRVLAQFAHVNPGWLLTGHGDRYLVADEDTYLTRIRAILDEAAREENMAREEGASAERSSVTAVRTEELNQHATVQLPEEQVDVSADELATRSIESSQAVRSTEQVPEQKRRIPRASESGGRTPRQK